MSGSAAVLCAFTDRRMFAHGFRLGPDSFDVAITFTRQSGFHFDIP